VTGLRLFAARFRERPLATFGNLLLEYLGYFSACTFALLLLLMRVPLVLLERLTGLPIRRYIIDLVARLATG